MVCPFGNPHMRIYIENIKTFSGNGYYVGRASPLGNHFPLSLGRLACIEAYRIYMTDFLRNNRRSTAYYYFDFLRTQLIILEELHLVCHCSPLPCHATVIADLIIGGDV